MMHTVSCDSEVLGAVVRAQKGDMILCPSYRTQEVVQEMLESIGFEFEEVHTLAQVAGPDAAELTDWLCHKAEGGI
jgi:hypothetical protein